MIDRTKAKSLAIFMALSLVLILVLAACGGQQNASNVSSNPAANTAQTNTTANNNDMAADNGTGTNNNNSAGGDSATQDSAGGSSSSDTSSPDPQPTAMNATVSYSADVAPIFNSRCANCHGGRKTEAEFVILNYADLLAGGENGAVIVPGNADGSKLVELITSGEMPKRGPKLTPVEIDLIRTWINEGAQDN